MCDRIVSDREAAMATRITRPPRHLSSAPEENKTGKPPKQTSFLE